MRVLVVSDLSKHWSDTILGRLLSLVTAQRKAARSLMTLEPRVAFSLG